MAVLLADVVNRADVGMVQGGGHARLTAKPLENLRVANDRVRKELQRHRSGESRVLGFIDDTHAAGAELLEDAIVGDSSVDHRSGCYSPDYTAKPPLDAARRCSYNCAMPRTRLVQVGLTAAAAATLVSSIALRAQ